MSNTLPSLHGADTERRHQAFLVCAAGLAERHKLYLEEEGKTIADCYKVALSSQDSHLEIHPGVPFDLYEELNTCWKHCFR